MAPAPQSEATVVRSYHLWATVTCLLLAAFLSAVLPCRDARAQSLAACPTPTPIGGVATDTAQEVGRLRVDQAQTCRAITERIDRLHADAAGAEGQRATINDRLAVIRDRLAGTLDTQLQPNAGSATEPLFVTGPAGSQFGQQGPTGSPDDPITSQLHDPDSRQLFSARFFLAFGCGLLLLSVVAPIVRRVWFP